MLPDNNPGSIPAQPQSGMAPVPPSPPQAVPMSPPSVSPTPFVQPQQTVAQTTPIAPPPSQQTAQTVPVIPATPLPAIPPEPAPQAAQPAPPLSPSSPSPQSQPVVAAPPSTSRLPQLFDKFKNKKSLIIAGVAALLLVTMASIFAIFGNRSDYQLTINKFIAAEQNNDQKTSDSLLSSDAKAHFKKEAGNESFYAVCKQAGEFCTGYFDKRFLASATKTYSAYKSDKGAKGKQITYTVDKALSGVGSDGKSCDSISKNTLTIAVVPKLNSWVINAVDQTSDSNVQTCPQTN